MWYHDKINKTSKSQHLLNTYCQPGNERIELYWFYNLILVTILGCDQSYEPILGRRKLSKGTLHNLSMLTQLEEAELAKVSFRKVISGISAEGWIVVCKGSRVEMSNLSGGHTVHNPEVWARMLCSHNSWWLSISGAQGTFVGKWGHVRLAVFEVLWNLTTVS